MTKRAQQEKQAGTAGKGQGYTLAEMVPRSTRDAWRLPRGRKQPCKVFEMGEVSHREGPWVEERERGAMAMRMERPQDEQRGGVQQVRAEREEGQREREKESRERRERERAPGKSKEGGRE